MRALTWGRARVDRTLGTAAAPRDRYLDEIQVGDFGGQDSRGDERVGGTCGLDKMALPACVGSRFLKPSRSNGGGVVVL